MLGLGTSVVPDSSATSFFLEATLLAKFKTRVIDDGGSVESYSCMEQQLVPLLLEPTTFTTGLLEFYPNAAAAYSLRQLRRSVSPYAIRVRRANDDELDIGFGSDGELDTNALLDFADTGDVWVSVWYDQSSNGNDATQSTNADQPQIVSSGSVITENGKPTVQFDGADHQFQLQFTDLYGQSVLDAYITYATNDDSYILFSARPTEYKYGFVVEDANSSTNIHSYYSPPSGLPDLFINGTEYVLNNGTTTRDDLHTQLAQNQMILEVHQGATTSAWTDFSFSNYSGRRLSGNVSEIILYNSDQSGNRTGIEDNINDYYNIY